MVMAGVIALGYVYSVKAHDEMSECKSSQALIELMAAGDCPACDSCCPDCPPVQACSPGFSCQPDQLSGERQQYPPVAVEAWVQSVTGGGLVDVPLDDPRWGDREKGEVYAMENADFIVWYWPAGGEAVFDPTKLGGKAMWHDYRMASDNSSGGGPISLSAGMGIRFMDAGGGVSIFERLKDAPLPAGFLANYTNPEQAKVPADGIYPHGQRMLFGWYSANNKQFIRMKNAGFTTDGPQYHGGLGAAFGLKWKRGAEAGMKNWYRLKEVGGKWWPDLVRMLDTQTGRDKLRGNVTRMVRSVLANPALNDNVFAWYGFQEEMIHRKGSPQAPVEKQRAYSKFVHDVIMEVDPRKRPYFVSERSDSNPENLARNACVQDGVIKQNYLIKENGYGKDLQMRYLMHQWVLDMRKAAADADRRCPSYTGKRRGVYSTLSAYIDPDNTSLHNEKWLRKAITHDVYTQLAAGVHGINMWAWNSAYDWPDKTKPIQENIYLEVVAMIARSGLGKVFLWGDDRDDIKLVIKHGPATIKWRRHSNIHTAPSITRRNIQYGNNRYLLLVNESRETITVQLSGIPGELRITDLISGGTGSATTTIQPLGVRMYRISRG